MSRSSTHGWLARWLGGLTLVCGVSVSSRIAHAQPQPGPDPRLEAQLEAGEFAPASRAAAGMPRGNERDATFARLAAAQAEVGASTGAYLSATQVDNDSLRASALAQTKRAADSTAGRFGGTQADFDSLIDLIKSTIQPNTWDDAGGLGSADGFEGGVYCDADGTLRRILQEDRSGRLSALNRHSRLRAGSRSGAVTDTTPLRKVSLTRLEKHLERYLAEGKGPPDEMRNLAGLYRIRYVIVYPDERDVVLAGPAGDWREDAEGRRLNVESGRPVLQLDDLVVVLRSMLAAEGGRFGCSITPTQDGLARTKGFIEESNKRPLKPGQRGAWLNQLRDSLGLQDIEIYGIDPRTRAAHVLLEADYRMKLVGLGLEDGVTGVKSYLDSIVVKPGEPAPPMDVLRWWFTLNYQAVAASSERDVFEIRGQGVQVLSENELLTMTGQRVHTGAASPANQQFTGSFTEHFEQFAAKYPVYADLRNIFDLALVAALFKAEHLPERADWRMPVIGNAERYAVRLGPAPKQVPTVIAHRVVNRTQILVGISGGVAVNPATYVASDKIEVDSYGKLAAERTQAAAKELPLEAWWWD
ncbi:MAG: DUF1598 domain-containing protein [Pirellulales bacterium]